MQNRRGWILGGLVVVGLVVAVVALVRRRDHASAGGGAATATSRPGSGGGERGAPGAKLDPRTQAPATIVGVVRVDGGGPLPGALVCATRAVDDDDDGDEEPRCATTDAAGAYRLTPLVPGRHTVAASARGHQPRRWRGPPPDEDDTVTLTAGQRRQHVDLALTPGGAEVRGVVADVGGGPIADALVTVSTGASLDDAAIPTRTDVEGRFAVWTAQGAVVVAAEAEGYAPGELEASAPVRTLELVLTPESVLAGIVVEAGTGKPVADASVEAGLERVDMGRRSTSDTVRTGADGRFRLTRLAPGRYKPVATAVHGYGEAAASVLLGLGQRTEELVIELHPAYAVRGRVESERGGTRTPCAEGQVSLSLEGSHDTAGSDGTDAEGRVVIGGLLPGRYVVHAHCTGHVTPGDDEALVIGDRDVDGQVWRVTEGGTLRGVVRTSGGAPVVGLDLLARSLAGALDGALRTGRTREDGSYEITGLAAGRHLVDSFGDRRALPTPAPEATITTGRVTTLDLVLPAAGTIDGVVVEANGRPLVGATVSLRDDGRWSSDDDARTDEDGRFVMAGVTAGPHRVVTVDGWGTPVPAARDAASADVTVADGATTHVRLVVAAREGVITGSVRDERGQAVGDAWIVVRREGEGPGDEDYAVEATRWSWGAVERPVVTDPTGVFTVRGLARGSYTLRAFRKGGGEATRTHVAVGSAVTLTIAATASVSGTVVRTDGVAIELVNVSARDRTGYERSERFFRTGGAFTLRDLPAGTFSLVAEHAGARGSAEVTLAAGQQVTGQVLTLRAGLVVRGRLVDLDSRAPVPGYLAQVSARDERSFTISSVQPGGKDVADAEGRFELHDAQVGKVQLRLIPPGFPMNGALVEVPLALDESAGTVDLGDLEVVLGRLAPGQTSGRIGVALSMPPEDQPTAGVRIDGVLAGSPAAAAGVVAGDVLTTIDGHDVRGPRSRLASPLLAVPPGTKLTLGLARGATVTVTSGPRE